MSDADFTHDVFLSHSAKDKAVVRAVAERLRADGVRVWFDEWELKPGDSIPAKIEEGLEHSRVLVLCLSANAFRSDWAQLEAGTFRFRDPMNKERRFIPLRLDDAPIKGSLAQFLYINWLPQEREQGYAKLLEACRPPKEQLVVTTSEMQKSKGLLSFPKSRQASAKAYQQASVPIDQWLCNFLEWFYSNFGVNLLTILGHRFPAVGWKIDSQALPNANAVLEFDGPEPFSGGPAGFAIYDQDAIARRLATEKVLTNDSTFCLRHYDQDRRKVVGGLVGKYYDAIATCDALADKMRTAVAGLSPADLVTTERAFKRFSDRQILRRKLNQFCRGAKVSPVTHGLGRSAAIGVSTLTVFRVKTAKIDKFQALFARRSEKVANDPGAFHVVPSGMFQPSRDWRLPVEAGECEEEWDLCPHIYRETLEEIFDYQQSELKCLTGHEIRGKWESEFLNKPLSISPASGLEPECVTTGVIVNLLNLRLEICTLLLIKDPAWYKRHSQAIAGARPFRLSQIEFAEEAKEQHGGEPFLWRLTLRDHGRFLTNEEIAEQIGDVSPSRIVAPGAAALLYGLDALRHRF